MSLKEITFRGRYARIALIAAVVICLFLSWVFIRWNVANVAALRADTRSPDSRSIAEWLTSVSPSDPRTHVFAARVYETTFDSDDLNRTVQEFELAASLSPHNFSMWLNLGRARGLVGDSEGAIKSFARAMELAPNYSLVRWTYGNALLRAGQLEEGFTLVSGAADLDPQYLRSAISIALELFEGNVDEVRRAMGDTEKINAGLAEGLFSIGRIDESFDAWQRLTPGTKKGEFRDLAVMLRTKLIEIKRFRMAASLQSDIFESNVPAMSKVLNGGFEYEVKLGGTDIFNWRVSNGTHPQIGLSDGQKRSGQFGLLLVFNSFESDGFRSIDQTIAVEPLAEYELEIFYRSDIRTDAALAWEVVDASSSQTIVAAEPIGKTSKEWTPIKLRFRIPENADGIQIRLVRRGCGGPACPMSGRVAFDDISLTRL